jgi:hypothetical protein
MLVCLSAMETDHGKASSPYGEREAQQTPVGPVMLPLPELGVVN